ncbi:glutamate synthase-related protein [Amycolatopsis sp. NBC_00348]|uniref:glutamate synthase-related protein n=1 Tax=Amycolatopsis sp. NBC_00348 TaxID=2975956 RepID=UPI002E2678F1
MTALHAGGFPEDDVRARARLGAEAVFPPAAEYGTTLFGFSAGVSGDSLESARLVPPVFMPRRLEKLIELGREPLYGDVELDTVIGGFASALPLYLSAFGSTQVAGAGLGAAASAQAARLGIPMVVGENVVPVHGHGRTGGAAAGTLLERLRAYGDAVPDGLGGVVVQQSTEDADAEVWNLVYSDPSAAPLLDSGRLAFELKVGQGAKPGLGGMTLVDAAAADRLAEQYTVDLTLGDGVLRSSSPGTFTPEILRQQIRLMRNNFPRAGVWVKLLPGRDVASAATVAWAAGADAVTVDGAEGGTGWAPTAFLGVGLPLAECLSRIGAPAGCLLTSGRMWEGTRVAKVLALGARAAGLGRAALLAVDTDPREGLVRFVEALALELRLLVSALGQYRADALTRDDVWFPDEATQVREQVLS